MGLDVFLYHCPNRPEARAAEEALSAYENDLWNELGPYESIPPATKEELRAKVKAKAEELGCTERYGSHESVRQIEEPSALDPDHMFKIGYLRSSYNGGGINSYLKRRCLPDLNDIFEPDEEYEFTPDWEACRERANEAVRLYEEAQTAPGANLDVLFVGPGFADIARERPDSPEAALAVAIKHVSQERPEVAFRSYSNGEGQFYLDGMRCVAFIPGTRWEFEGPGVYVVYDRNAGSDDGDGDTEDWYLTALKITREMIDYVLAQPDPENYYLHWSA